jgi:hypothetical protein
MAEQKIQTRVFQYGDPKESTWPPMFGKGGSGLYHRGEDGKFHEGPPPPRFEKFGEAPYVIQDTIAPYRHPSTGEVIESRARLNATDRACGTFTTDKKQDCTDIRKSRERQLAVERKKDIHEAMRKAVAAVDSGNAPLSEETRHRCEVQNRIVSDALGFDAFNVCGKKDDRRGKKYRKRT